jgi:hypothetical protein
LRNRTAACFKQANRLKLQFFTKYPSFLFGHGTHLWSIKLSENPSTFYGEVQFWCKGIFWSSNAPDVRQSLQAVGRRTKINQLGSWVDRPRKTQIVAIGRDIPIDTLEELFGSLVEEEIVA